MPFFFFAWTEDALEHVGLNGVSAEEFEEVVCNPIENGVSRSTGRPLAFGWTATGRFLVCVYERIDADTVIPITAYESDED